MLFVGERDQDLKKVIGELYARLYLRLVDDVYDRSEEDSELVPAARAGGGAHAPAEVQIE